MCAQAMWNILAEQKAKPNHKVIVFFVTARCTQVCRVPLT